MVGTLLMYLMNYNYLCKYVFGASDPNMELYADGFGGWQNICFGYYSVSIFICFYAYSSKLMGNIRLHFMCLIIIGGIGLISIGLIHNQYFTFTSNDRVGIACGKYSFSFMPS